MKRFSIVYFVVVLALVFSCSEEKEKVSKPGSINYFIKATVINAKGDEVYLEEIREKQWVVIDSTKLTDGKFELNGNVPAVDIYRLRFAENAFVPLLLNTDKIVFTADLNQPFETVVFSGSKENEVYADFNNKMLIFNKKHEELHLCWIR
jgi:hypothetical protein